jgi:hypothetical protein
MKKLGIFYNRCNGINGSSGCRLSKKNKEKIELWQCKSCGHKLCTACMKINKYLNMIGNLRLS